ncbi:Vps54-like protein [Glomus cerebriforme]|uniref:Vacuolar protein sorting-associated protein 54 n=1 Tax=Glomus cerebriforme TaxID=658196 RepID=A0A397S0C2_9GLOM|nr:Vps54-like protein [Glomus cerebriforme]
MDRNEEIKQNSKSPTIDVESSVAGRSDSTSPKSSKTQGSAASPPQTPRRFSSSSARSFDNSDYFTNTFKNQRVPSAMSLYGRGYSRGLARRVSMNSSISNFSTMSETSLPWTTKDIGFNAISGVLNNPNTKSSNSVRPSKNDIPTVPHVNIRKVKPSDFNSYIKQITPVFERYSHNKELGAEGLQSRKSTLPITESPATSVTNLLASNLENLQGSKETENQIPVHRLASTRNPYTVHLPLPSPGDDRTPEPVIELPLLETVPSIFFDPEFNLENPRTFDIVCEQTDIIGGNPNNPTISTNAILQEKLSHYLDTVEVHLIKEISLRSSSFFAALSNLQALHSETLECISQINNLREKLNEVDNTQAKKGLEVVRLKRRRVNMGRLYEGLRMVSEIRSTQPMIQVLLGQGDYFSALDLIDEANNILHGDESQRIQLEEKIVELETKNLEIINPKTTMVRRLNNVADEFKRSGTIDLRSVKVLMHFSGQLTEMYKSIGVMMENDLLNMLFLDFEENVEKVNKSDIIKSLYNYKIPQSTKQSTTSINVTIDSEIMEKEDNLKKRITPLILGLYRVNRLASTFHAYHERILEEIKKIIQVQKHHPSSISHTDSREDQLSDWPKEQSSKMAKLLKGMTFDSFLDMLLSIYAVLLEGMKRIAIYNELFTTILGDVEISGYQIQIGTEITEGEKKPLNDDNQTLGNESDVKDEQATATPKNDSSISLDKESKLKNDSNGSLDRLTISRKDSNSSLDKEENSKSDSSSSVNSTSSLNSRFSALKITTGIKSIIQKTSSLTNKPSLSTPAEKEAVVASSPSAKKKSKKSKSDSNHSQSISDSAQIVYAAADLAHVRCANLIAVRADQNAQLNQKDFYRLFNVTSAFVLECEGLCGRMCYGLRGTIMSQAKAFLNHFHMERTRQAATLVENEQWVQEQVPIDFQRIIDKIVSAAISGLSDFKDDPADSTSSPISPVFPMSRFSTSSRNGDSENTIKNTSNGTTKTPPVSQLNSGSSKYIFVEERRFFVVGCSLTLIKLLGDYLRCMANIPTLTTEAMNRIVDILNLFNSRTCQVILGAGAMKSAGLKNITAKHLALASQSLGLMIILIPFIRECIRHSLNTKQAVMLTEFDRIKRDYVNHQNEIHGKLVSIMSERLAVHLKSFQAINWDEVSSREGPNQYMEVLVKETTTLHKVLNKYLPPEILQNVMTEVFNSSNTKLSEEIGNTKIITATGKKRLMTDAQYYIRKLSTLEGLQGPSNDLEIAVNNIQINDNSSKEDLPNVANTTTNTSPPSSK